MNFRYYVEFINETEKRVCIYINAKSVKQVKKIFSGYNLLVCDQTDQKGGSMKYSELAIREAVDIAVGDDGSKSKEVIEILRLLEKEEA